MEEVEVEKKEEEEGEEEQGNKRFLAIHPLLKNNIFMS